MPAQTPSCSSVRSWDLALKSALRQTRPWSTLGLHLLEAIRHKSLHHRNRQHRKCFISVHFRLQIILTLLRNGYSASRQSAPTSNLNPWATISTRSTESSIEAQQPRATFTESAPPTSAPQPPATTASRFEQNRERQRQLELHNAGREGDMPRRATRAPAAFTREKQTLVRPRSDSTTNASSPTPSVEFIDNRLPVDDVFKNNVHYDWELQEYIESQPSRSRDNSRAYSREQIDRANPQRPMILQPRVKQYTKQGSRRCKSYAITSFFFLI